MLESKRQKCIIAFISYLTKRKYNNKEKEPGNGPFQLLRSNYLPNVLDIVVVIESRVCLPYCQDPIRQNPQIINAFDVRHPAFKQQEKNLIFKKDCNIQKFL